MEIDNARRWGAYGTDEEIGSDLVSSGSMILFSVVLSHSQLLAPMTAMFAAWVLCDMLFVARKLTIVHSGVLALAPLLLYLTRSRTGLLAFGVAIVMICFYALPKARISRLDRARMRGTLTGVCVLMVIAAVVFEIRSQSMSSWLYKWNRGDVYDVDAVESIAGTRLGLISNNLDDFKRNPFLGMGFQVAENHKYLYERGRISILSAPIEKGVLPTMILGEGGVLGALTFSIFIVGFYGFFIKRKYVATVTLFTTFLATNMGEASFFSPGGHGGLYWLISVAGGMCVDYLSRIDSYQFD